MTTNPSLWYAAVEKFGPQNGERWDKYIAWSGLVQLTELVSLDGLLCPRVIEDLTDEDWDHNVQADFCLFFFLDLPYLMKRVGEAAAVNFLAVIRDPIGDVEMPAPAGFDFCGFDLIETDGSISALTNCGGFPESFDNSELTELGLIGSFSRVKEIQEALRLNNPEEPHAECSIWAIWRRAGRAV